MKTALEQTLAPCPFCGGEASMRNGGPGCFFVQCDLCNATSDDGSRDRAIAVWNSRAALPSGPVTEEATPAAKWRQEGKEDPHGNRYDCERAKLGMGHLTDDELANAVFMADRSSLDLIAYQTAAKDRIRWLSRALEAAIARQPGAGEPVAVETLRQRLDQAVYATETARTQTEWDAACTTMTKQLEALGALGIDRDAEYQRACAASKARIAMEADDVRA